eukprot:1125029-Pyramimonas_sp.AAC.1
MGKFPKAEDCTRTLCTSTQSLQPVMCNHQNQVATRANSLHVQPGNGFALLSAHTREVVTTFNRQYKLSTTRDKVHTHVEQTHLHIQ